MSIFQGSDFLKQSQKDNEQFIDRCIQLGYCTKPRPRESWEPIPRPPLHKYALTPKHAHDFRDDGSCRIEGCEVTRQEMHQIHATVGESPALRQAIQGQPVINTRIQHLWSGFPDFKCKTCGITQQDYELFSPPRPTCAQISAQTSNLT